MRIKRIVSQHRRDFTALYECEHCAAETEGRGYDDAYFHECAVPQMVCKDCGKKASDDCRPLATKYPEHFTV